MTDIILVGGSFSITEIQTPRNWLEYWPFSKLNMPYVVIETLYRPIRFLTYEEPIPDTNSTTLPQHIFGDEHDTILRLHIFGEGGDFTFRRDANMIYWRYVGNEWTDFSAVGGNYFESTLQLGTTQRSLLWGTKGEKTDKRHEGRVGGANLNYPTVGENVQAELIAYPVFDENNEVVAFWTQKIQIAKKEGEGK